MLKSIIKSEIEKKLKILQIMRFPPNISGISYLTLKHFNSNCNLMLKQTVLLM